MKKNVHRPARLYNTDTLMRDLWLNLRRDFSANCEMIYDDTKADASLVKSNSFAQYRSLDQPTYYLSPYYYFKCRYQLNSLFKRYRFQTDLYTDSELEVLSTTKFLDTQERIKLSSVSSTRASLVFQRAAVLVKDILGSFDSNEHAVSCRFGKRASVGNPKKVSYLDTKLRTLSGSRDHISWFKDHLSGDLILTHALEECPYRPFYSECDVLDLTTVPKSFKALRCILANTTIGSFYTYGLGKVIQKRLTKVGLHIPYLQERHRRLVQKFSRTCTHATADLSSASDSFTIDHLRLLLPKDWLDAILLGRIDKVKIGNETHQLTSVMTMGIGFTFQLQTLLFYCLLKAIQSLSKIKGLISVYGDDLIYPSEMHRYVRHVFEDVGFILNEDKTFVKQSFRESCGSDCYCGIDVRPFQPEGQHRMLSARLYELQVYKTINGLLRRWSREEVPSSLHYLHRELLRVSNVVYQVPPSFPDYSGVRVEAPISDYLMPWAQVSRRGNALYIFSFLAMLPKDRYVESQYPFYWNTLRAKGCNEEEDCETHYRQEPRINVPRVQSVINRLLGCPLRPVGDSIHDTVTLRWVKTEHDRRNYRSTLTGKRLRKLTAVVPDKERPQTIRRQLATSLEWT